MKNPCSFLLSSERRSEVAALLKRIGIRGIVRYDTICNEIGAGIPASVFPIPHPLAIAPSEGPEKSDFLALKRVLDGREHGIEFGLFQDLCSHGGAAESDPVKA